MAWCACPAPSASTAPRTLAAFSPERQWVARGVGHLDLLSSKAVANKVETWLLGPGADGTNVAG